VCLTHAVGGFARGRWSGMGYQPAGWLSTSRVKAYLTHAVGGCLRGRLRTTGYPTRLSSRRVALNFGRSRPHDPCRWRVCTGAKLATFA